MGFQSRFLNSGYSSHQIYTYAAVAAVAAAAADDDNDDDNDNDGDDVTSYVFIPYH